MSLILSQIAYQNSLFLHQISTDFIVLMKDFETIRFHWHSIILDKVTKRSLISLIIYLMINNFQYYHYNS